MNPSLARCLLPAWCRSRVYDSSCASEPQPHRNHFPHLSATSLFTSLSASVGLCNFLSESLPALLHVCPPASAPLLRPQRDIIFFSRNNDLFAFLPGVHELQDNIISFIILVECFIFPLLHLTPLRFSLFCPLLLSGRQEGWLRGCCPPAKANS